MRACCLLARQLRDIEARVPKLRTPVSAASRAMWKLHQLLERGKASGRPVPSDEILAHIGTGRVYYLPVSEPGEPNAKSHRVA